MDVNDLRVMLVQELGMDASVREKMLVVHWKLDDDMNRQLLFYVDDETNLVYITTRFDEVVNARAKLMEHLLLENMNLSLVKFGIDKEGCAMALVEIPAPNCTGALLKRGILAIYRASARYFEILKEHQDR